MIDFTTVERVKGFLTAGGTSMDNSQNEVLQALITAESARWEELLGRTAETGEYTDYFDVEPGQRIITLHAFPVHVAEEGAALEVRVDTPREFPDSSILEPSLYYVNRARGYVEFDKYELPGGPGVVQVTWTGGMTSGGETDPTDSFMENYPDLTMAMNMQVAETWRRRNRMSATNTSFEGGGHTFEGALKLLPLVQHAIDLHRRVVLR
jgi:hypothetical protein